MPEIETTIQRPFLAACPLCSHEQLAYQFRSAGTPIVRCEGCGLFMRNPQPSDVELAPNQVALARYARQGAVLDDVLHRTRDPLATLVDIWHALAPGGDLTITVPSLDRSSIRLEQLFFFDGQTLQLLLFRAGFENVRVVIERGAIRATARRSALLPPIDRAYTLSVVMPVFNERDTFSEIFEAVYAKRLPRVNIDIVIVESQSTDGTRELVANVAERRRVRVIYEDRPRGKGHAVRNGLAQATGDFVLIQDADTEYDVNDYDQLVEALIAGRAAFVLGSRHGIDGNSWKMRHFTDQVLVSRVMNFGHIFFTALFNIVYRQRLRDPFTMFKVFRRDCLFGLTFESNRFDFDWELVAKLVRAGYTPLEIPVNYTSRSFSKGKKVSLWRDPWTYFRACFKYRFVRLGK